MSSRLLVCGVINWDTTLFVDRLPSAGEEMQVRRMISVPGGKGGNTAVTAARILGPSKVTLVAGLGDDDVAQRQIQVLEKEGVDTGCIIFQRKMASGQAYIVVDNQTGENMILTHMAANLLQPDFFFPSQHFQDAAAARIAEAVSGARMIIVIDPPFEVASRLAGSKSKDQLLVLSPALLTNLGLGTLRSYLEKADYVVLNEQEAGLLMQSPAAPDSIADAGSRLSRLLGGKRVIITLGSRGCALFSGDKKALIPPLDLDYFGLKVVSTVGAGDTLVGIFASFKVEGLDDIESLFRACIAAGLKTTREETRGSPDKEMIEYYAGQPKMRMLLDSVKLT